MGVRHLKCAGLLLAFAAAAPAQFSQLAVTDDASEVYFLTTLRLLSEAPKHLPNTGSIYRLFDRVVTAVTTPPPSVSYPAFSSRFVGNPQVSGDGTVFSYTDSFICRDSYCNCPVCPFQSSVSSLVFVGGHYGSALPGNAQVSRNGRFLLAAGELLDRQTGQVLWWSGQPGSNRQALTSAGAVLGIGPLALYSIQSTLTLTSGAQPVGAIVNDTGAWVIYWSPSSDLHSIELSTATDRLLAPAAQPSPSISNDGSLVLYLSGHPAQAFLIRPDGTGRRQLTNFSEGITEAVLSGNGQTVVAVAGPRIVSIDISTGAIRGLLSAPLACGESAFSPTPRPCIEPHR